MTPEPADAPLDAIELALVRALAAAYLKRRAATAALTPAEPDLPAGGKTPTSNVPAGGNDGAAV